ncbi:MAG: HAD-IIA family hydrolase [Salinarchaeum sp.]
MTIQGAIVDVDGTLVRGNQSLPGAAAGLDSLTAAGVDLLLFSNNPTRPGEYYETLLTECSLPVDEHTAITAATVTAEHLAAEHPTANIYVVGEAGLHERLRAHGLHLVSDPTAADVVVGSIDRDLGYDDLRKGLRALQHADRFVATDPDPAIPTGDGLAPGSGAIIAALRAAADRPVDAVLGKPSPIARAAALERLGVPPESCLVVGDRLDTDIALGEAAGMQTALVLTGVTDRATLAAADQQPDYVLESIAEVHTLLPGASRKQKD